MDELEELRQAIVSLPLTYQQKLLPALEKVAETSQRRRKILLLVQEALGQLRLDLSYLKFDLESTRNERDELREKLG